ncbi:MAG TPA: glucoamylase family protein [Longimicrobiales bacterium]|nr:glucoamylase family protein [Longimicrobiales bacterium]
MRRSGFIITCLLAFGAGCASAPVRPASDAAFLDDVQQRTFAWFWDYSRPDNGIVRDRAPSASFASIASVGFGLTAYPIGVERGYITRAQARQRTLATLRHFWTAPQGPEPTGDNIGYRGSYFHFLDWETGLRHQLTELSSIDTALLIAGVLFSREYFGQEHADEAEIRALADSIYLRVDWAYFQEPGPALRMSWRPERGFGPAEWLGYNEGIILLVLALGSPTHPVGTEAWDAWAARYPGRWGEFYGYEHLMYAPLFVHQYSHVWIDFRGIQDEFMRGRGIDYFENSRRATLSQRAYGVDNPGGWRDYGADIWGLTASSGPLADTIVIDGRARVFRRYWARGAARGDIRDDGTIVPTAAGGSIPFAPDETIAALRAMRERYGELVFREYGFVDAFNPTLDVAGVTPARGRIVPGVGWFEDDYLGIDQGPIIAMIENHRTGLVWEYMKRNSYLVRGLCRAGFTGGWLEGRCGE